MARSGMDAKVQALVLGFDDAYLVRNIAEVLM